MAPQVNFIALDIKRWILEHKKISSVAYLLINNEEKTVQVDSSILKPNDMLDNFMGKLRAEISSKLLASNGSSDTQFEFENQTFLRQRLFNYFKRISGELRGGNNGKNENNHRGIRTTHLDIYTEDDDITILPKHIQFMVTLNWCRNYYDREEYKKAIDPLRKLIKLDPQFGTGYKWLARSLKKIRKYEEGMSYYQKYAEVDGSTDAYLDLAKSYRKGKIFDKSEEIYADILISDPSNKEAQIGLAQIKFALNQPDYMNILDKLHQQDSEWLKKWLVDEFNFRIYIPEKTFITPAQATKFLGFSKVFELTERAFKNEIPSHFNPAKARMSFYKEELENWAEVMNHFHCVEKEIKLYPESIVDTKASQKATSYEDTTSRKSDESSNKKLEQMLKEIREMKARRAAHQIGPSLPKRQGHSQKSPKESQPNNASKKETPKKTVQEDVLSEIEN
jgi:tetratricopeptide (TPR) repeat protein